MLEKFKKLYNEVVIPHLKENFKYQNIQEIPKIKKIQINRGLGIAAQNTKVLKKSIEEFRAITGQNPVVTKAKQSIAGFKVREKMELGITITLRGEKMYSFLDRLINLALPRIRDFQGLKDGFDGRGNYTFGITEQIIFPEIEIDKVNRISGMDITFVTSANTDKECKSLLQSFGMPFKK